MCDAFESININKSQQKELFNIIISILHLGNIQFEQKSEQCEDSIITNESKEHLKYSYQLLNINEHDLIKRLTTRSIKVGLETIESPLRVLDSNDNRNSIAKILYSKLFDFIVKSCNNTLGNKNYNDNDDNTKFIGILDIFGFESFEYRKFNCQIYAPFEM